MVSDSERGVLFMFGGERHNFNHDMSMWLYSLSTNAWSKGSTAPEPRSGHNMAKLNRAVMVFGGYSHHNYGLTNRLLSYDISNDIWEDTRASNPPWIRAYAALAAFEEQELLLLFGGLRCGIRDHPCDPPVGDLWSYSATGNRWEQLFPDGPKPAPRYLASSAAYEGGFIIFGGRSATDEHLADLWHYDVSSNTWAQLPGRPYPRSRA